MRIAVDFRILVVGPHWLNRGMGRFTQQQLAAVLALDPHNDYFVLCDPTADLSLLAPGIRAAPNAFVRVPPAWTPHAEGGFGSTLRRGEQLQEFLGGLDVALYHSATPFLLWEPLVPQFDVCPVVATLYDLIPLVYPGHYLGTGHEGAYFRALERVKRADRVLAISESAKKDAELYIGVPPSRVDVAYPAADDVFGPMAPDVARAVLSRWGRVPTSFALAVSAFHQSKNVVKLLEAYASLPRHARDRLPLLLGGHFGPPERATIGVIAARLGIVDDLVFTGVVSDRQLAALYSCATVVVHASRYEGFGYPVLEAMSCGAPVVTSTSSSLPEVAGDAAILVDPDDADGLAAAMLAVAADRDLRDRMREQGLQRASRFSQEALAEATLGCYRRTVSADPVAPRPGSITAGTAEPLRVALWTPLPPLQTGIADYAVELLGQLGRRYEVEVFVDDGYLPDGDLLERFRIYHASAFARRHAQDPFDVTIYQMGNSKFHWYIYQQVRRHPGIVVLHDLGVSPILYDRCYTSGDFEPFLDELAAVEGVAVRDRFVERFESLSGAERDAFSVDFLRRRPMLRSVTTGSQAVVVHTEAAARRLRRQCPGVEVAVVGMGVAAPPPSRAPLRRLQARRRLGYAPDAFVVASFGIVHETKLLEQAIRAMAALVDKRPDACLVVVGRALSPNYASGLVELAHEVGVGGHVRLLGHVPRQSFDLELAACDVVVNLRSPSASHMSAILMRALGAGKPVVMSALDDWDAIPDRACFRVPSGPDEVATIARHLVTLAGDPGLAARTSAAAQAWFARHGTVAAMAEGYSRVMHAVVAREVTGAARGAPVMA